MPNNQQYQDYLQSIQNLENPQPQVATPPVQEQTPASPVPYTQPVSTDTQLQQMKNYDKISPFEKWVYGWLPPVMKKIEPVTNVIGEIGKTTIGKALGPWTSKLLSWLDVGAEAIERTIGTLSQYQTGEEFKFSDAWNAGSLYYDMTNFPKVVKGADGQTHLMVPTDLPGMGGLIWARQQIAAGKSLADVKQAYYNDIGALQLRAQGQDMLGHIVLDPINIALPYLKPVERIQAVAKAALGTKIVMPAVEEGIKATEVLLEGANKVLETAPKDVDALAEVAKQAKNLEHLNAMKKSIEAADGTVKELSAFDKFAIRLTGGDPLEPTAWGKSKLNPFALTKQARVHELVDVMHETFSSTVVSSAMSAVEAGTMTADKAVEEIGNAALRLAKGSYMGEAGNVFLSLEGRFAQSTAHGFEGEAMKWMSEWKLTNIERTMVNDIGKALNMQNTQVLKAVSKDSAGLVRDIMAKITEGSPEVSQDLLKMASEGKLTDEILTQTAKIFEGDGKYLMDISGHITSLLERIDTQAYREGIKIFDLKDQPALLTRWSNAIKSAETLAFIRMNPANMVRNAVNNEVTMIARGAFGFMSPGEIASFWKETGFVPSRLAQAFGIGGDIKTEMTEGEKLLAEAVGGKTSGAPEKMRALFRNIELGKFDFAKLSNKFEQSASRRAYTNFYLKYMSEYAKPPSLKSFLSPDEFSALRKVNYDLPDLIEGAWITARGNEAKFNKILQGNLRLNVKSVFNDIEKSTGKTISDLLDQEAITKIYNELPQAMSEGKIEQFAADFKAHIDAHAKTSFDEKLTTYSEDLAQRMQVAPNYELQRQEWNILDTYRGFEQEHGIHQSETMAIARSYQEKGDFASARKWIEKGFADESAVSDNMFRQQQATMTAIRNGADRAQMIAAEAGKTIKVPNITRIEKLNNDVRQAWKDFHAFKQTRLTEIFAGDENYAEAIAKLNDELTGKYDDIAKIEKSMSSEIDKILLDSVEDKALKKSLSGFRSSIRKVVEENRTAIQKVTEATSLEVDPAKRKALWDAAIKAQTERLNKINGKAGFNAMMDSAFDGDKLAIDLGTRQSLASIKRKIPPAITPGNVTKPNVVNAMKYHGMVDKDLAGKVKVNPISKADDAWFNTKSPEVDTFYQKAKVKELPQNQAGIARSEAIKPPEDWVPAGSELKTPVSEFKDIPISATDRTRYNQEVERTLMAKGYTWNESRNMKFDQAWKALKDTPVGQRMLVDVPEEDLPSLWKSIGRATVEPEYPRNAWDVILERNNAESVALDEQYIKLLAQSPAASPQEFAALDAKITKADQKAANFAALRQRERVLSIADKPTLEKELVHDEELYANTQKQMTRLENVVEKDSPGAIKQLHDMKAGTKLDRELTEDERKLLDVWTEEGKLTRDRKVVQSYLDKVPGKEYDVVSPDEIKDAGTFGDTFVDSHIDLTEEPSIVPKEVAPVPEPVKPGVIPEKVPAKVVPPVQVGPTPEERVAKLEQLVTDMKAKKVPVLPKRTHADEVDDIATGYQQLIADGGENLKTRSFLQHELKLTDNEMLDHFGEAKINILPPEEVMNISELAGVFYPEENTSDKVAKILNAIEAYSPTHVRLNNIDEVSSDLLHKVLNKRLQMFDHPEMARDQFMWGMKRFYNLTDTQAIGIASLQDNFAKSLGMSTDEWYNSHFLGFVEGGKADYWQANVYNKAPQLLEPKYLKDDLGIFAIDHNGRAVVEMHEKVPGLYAHHGPDFYRRNSIPGQETLAATGNYGILKDGTTAVVIHAEPGDQVTLDAVMQSYDSLVKKLQANGVTGDIVFYRSKTAGYDGEKIMLGAEGGTNTLFQTTRNYQGVDRAYFPNLPDKISNMNGTTLGAWGVHKDINGNEKLFMGWGRNYDHNKLAADNGLRGGEASFFERGRFGEVNGTTQTFIASFGTSVAENDIATEYWDKMANFLEKNGRTDTPMFYGGGYSAKYDPFKAVSDTLYQGGEQAKAGVKFLHQGDNVAALYKAFAGADASSAVHEGSHTYVEMLRYMVDQTGDVHLTERLNTLEKWAGVTDGVWDTAAHEKVARGFEYYMRVGKVPTGAPDEVRSLYAQIKLWLKDIYAKIKGSDIEGVKLSPEIRNVFDEMVGGKATGAEEIFKETSQMPRAVPIEMPTFQGVNEIALRQKSVLDDVLESAGNQMRKPAANFGDIPPSLTEKMGAYIDHARGSMAEARYAADRFGAYGRDASLLNYSRRTNFDAWASNAYPFAFWTTHSIGNWVVGSIDRPAMLTTYLRFDKLLRTAGIPEESVPTRVQGKIRIHLPFLPDWMGDQYIDPLRIILPFENFAQPYEQYQQIMTTAQGRAQRLLDKQLQSGTITQQQYNDALSTHSGDLWTSAMDEVRANDETMNFDTWDFANAVSSPHAPIVWAIKIAQGHPEEIGPFTPFSRSVRSFANTLGIDWNNSPLNVEAAVRRKMGLPAFDQWDDYKIDRMLSNMAADGTITADAAKRAMIDRTGPEFQEATKRANTEFSGGPAGFLLGTIGLSPVSVPYGEEYQRGLQSQFFAASDKYHAADKELQAYADAHPNATEAEMAAWGKAHPQVMEDKLALDTFFQKHPEYEARLAIFAKPADRLRSFMVDNLWSTWMALPTLTKNELKDQLGNDFNDMFLNKNTRAIDQVPVERLAIWLKLMGGNPPGTMKLDPTVDQKLKVAPPEIAQRAQSFYDYRTQYFPDYYTQQDEYFKLTAGTARSNYLTKHPMLKSYWDWRKDYLYRNPDVAEYLVDTSTGATLPTYPSESAYANVKSAQPNLTWKEWQTVLSPSLQQLVLSHFQTGNALPQAATQYLDMIATQYNVTGGGTALLKLIAGSLGQ